MKRSLINSFFSILLKACGAVSLLFMNLAVVSTYGSQVAGEFFTYLSILYIFSAFIRHGTDTYTVKYLSNSAHSDNNNLKSDYFFSRLYVISKLYALCSIGFLCISQFLTISFNKFYFATVYFHALIFFCSFYLQSQFNQKLAILFNSILIPSLFTLLLVLFSIDINAYFSFSIACFLVLLLVLITLKPHLKFPSTFKLNELERKYSHNYKLFWLVSMLNILTQWSPVFFAGILMSYSDNTIFTLAHRVAMLISFSLIAINAYIVPHYARLSEQTERKKLQKLVSKIATILSFLSLLSFALVILFIFSDTYEFELESEYQTFKVIVAVLCMGQLISAIFGSVGYLLQLTNFVKFYVLSISISLIFMGISYIGFYVAESLNLLNFSCITALGVITQNVLAWLFLVKKASINTIVYRWPL